MFSPRDADAQCRKKCGAGEVRNPTTRCCEPRAKQSDKAKKAKRAKQSDKAKKARKAKKTRKPKKSRRNKSGKSKKSPFQPTGKALGIVHTALQGVAPIEFIGLTGGEFVMGSPRGQRQAVRQRRHRVRLSEFEISRTEVTQAQWNAVMARNPSRCFKPGCTPDQPVQNISWLDAIGFLNELSRRERLTACYRVTGDQVTWNKACDGYRLPTEAEWEYACRAGSRAAYGFGSDASRLDKFARLGQPKRSGPQAVAKLRPNAWGLHDVHGNVFEWVWDRFGAYEPGRQSDPSGPETGAARAMRGGAFTSAPDTARCAHRAKLPPSARSALAGLRVVRGPLTDPSGTASTGGDRPPTARALFKEGQQLVDQGDFAAACPTFAASLQLDRSALKTRLSLADCYEKVGKLASAWSLFRSSARLASQRGARRQAALARQRSDALEPRLPRLVIALKGAQPADLDIIRDGAPVPRKQIGKPIYVDPGPHTIDASAPGYEPLTISVVAIEGEVAEVAVKLRPRHRTARSSSSGADMTAIDRMNYSLGLPRGAFGAILHVDQSNDFDTTLSPDIRYGITDDLAVGVTFSEYGNLGDQPASLGVPYDVLTPSTLYRFRRGDWLQLAARVGIPVSFSESAIAAHVELNGVVRLGWLRFTFNPGIVGFINNRGSLAVTEQVYLPVAVELAPIARARLALQTAVVAETGAFGDDGWLPVALAASVRVIGSFTIGASFGYASGRRPRGSVIGDDGVLRLSLGYIFGH